MMPWPATRLTLLDRIRDPQNQDAWTQFVGLYGPPIFHFARRRLPQDEDAADVMQEVLSAVLRGRYERTGAFQKWILTILLNKIRDFYAARRRRNEVSGSAAWANGPEEEPVGVEREWRQETQRQLFHAVAARVQARVNPTHWDVFVRTALQQQSGKEVAAVLHLSVTNVYAIRSRIIREIRDEIARFGGDRESERGPEPEKP